MLVCISSSSSFLPPLPRLSQGDSACERVFTVNDVSHGGCKYGIMNFSSSSRGSLSVEMCDNLYFTNRKVGVFHRSWSSDSKYVDILCTSLYLCPTLHFKDRIQENIGNVCDSSALAKCVSGEFHLLGLSQLPRLPRLVSFFSFNSALSPSTCLKTQVLFGHCLYFP